MQLLKSYSLSIILIFILRMSYSQNVEVVKGDAIENGKKIYTGTAHVIGGSKSTLFALGYDFFTQNSYYLDKYDSRLNFIESNPIIIPGFNKKTKYKIESAYYLKNQLYIFVSTYNSSKKQTVLFAAKMSPSAQIDDLKEVAQSSSSPGTFIINYSPDSTKFCVQVNDVNLNKIEKLGYTVTDMELNVLWKKDILLPNKSKWDNIFKTLIDNDGTSYCLVKTEIPKNKQTKGGQKYYYELLSYNHQIKLEKKIKIEVEKYVVSRIDLKFENDNIVCAGFYGTDEYSMKGTLICIIDKEVNEIKSLTIQELPQEVIQPYIKRNFVFAYKELINFELKDFYCLSDGSITIISEAIKDSRVPKINSYTKVIEYPCNGYFGDILITNITSDGKARSTFFISKSQYYTETKSSTSSSQKPGPNSSTITSFSNPNNKYYSFCTFLADDKIYLIYNDNYKNREKGLNLEDDCSALRNNIEKSETIIVNIEPDGKRKKDVLIPQDGTLFRISPRLNMKFSERSLIIFQDMGAPLTIVKLIFLN